MNATTQSNNNRIAKNTIFMYVRMLLIMAVSIYTSRINLSMLGVSDYGVYNVVGGIVAILAFLNGAMTAGTQRFLNFEIGKGNKDSVNLVFSTSMIIHVTIALVIFLFAESIGLWFLNTHMTIPNNRMEAANWVYQFSILSFMISIISVPYNAVIIAHEKMAAFAYIGVLEAFLKLAVAFALYVSPVDKLVLFAFLHFAITLCVRFICQIYSRKHFEETRGNHFRVNREKMKEMLSFSVWVIVGSLSGIFHTQGIGIIMNIFFDVTVNAAQGIANQVNGIVKQFIQNFTVALNPQIIKNYAANNLEDMYKLLMRGCRISFCLVAFFAIPIVLECPTILKLWLKDVPDYTVVFIRIIMLITLCDSFHSPLAASKNATGNIKNYQILLTTFGLSHIPLTWMFFKFGCGPEYAMYVYLFLSLCMQYTRIHLVCRSIGLKEGRFIRVVIARNILVLIMASILPVLAHVFLAHTIVSSCFVIVLCFIAVIISTIYIGFDGNERKAIYSMIMNKIKKQ